jgi:2',3'-cyclic-nucleotide 2'-phosphodiesterase (5'-nucleotidase family)
VTAPAGQAAAGAPAQITVLHINDTHAHLEDIARMATLVKQVRAEVGPDRVLMFDSGDVFMGTPYFNLMHGKADLEFMNTLGYDAMTLGNHEFDNYDKTPQYLNEFIADAKFPIVCTNIDFSRGPELKDKTLHYTIIEKGGQKFGIIGLTTDETPVIASPGKNVTFSGPVATAHQAVAELEKKGINKIIALTHIGWDKDIELAQQVSGIDVILGGHSHTLPAVYPTVVTNKEPTLVVQAEAYGKYLGRLDLSFDEKGVLTKYGGALSTIKDAAEDPDYAARLSKYKGPIDELKNTIAGTTLVDLDGERAHVRTMETNFGDLVADAFLAKSETVKGNIAIVNGGSIRTSIPAGDVSLGQTLEAIPFNNDIVAFDIKGEDLLAALENGVSQAEAVAGRFPQVAGLRFSWNPANQPGSRIQSVDIMTDGVFKPLDKSAIYRVVTNSYLFSGGDGYTSFKNGTNVWYLGFIDYDILTKYIAQHSPVSPRVEGRIVTVK